ncbi:MAG: shikimate kinase [Bacteroidetes bacterium]|nr:shikimate kinase [Bacteroidota bacterium]MDA0942985.1 shikimate kinase [Bacteroidota bacterium]MDA1111643.1 shikimate kinase [Bacteroidota bacterium]
MNKIFLVGLPAAGKSTVAVWLAERLGWTFVDLDHAIMEHTGSSVPQLFMEKGEAEFREIEAQVLREVSSQNNIVLGCGGGTAAFHDNMSYMTSRGLTVYLNTERTLLVDRIAESRHERPMFLGLDREQIQEKLTDILESRGVYYSQAKLVWNRSEPNEKLYFAVNQLVST